jgi:NADPH:quinone reductase-like Zn-dependent oxidoreductase
MSELPETQKAWIAVRRGSPRSALELRTDWPVPTKLEQGEVLVKVKAAALNPAGYKLLKYMPNFAAKRPRVMEQDFAGTIVDGNGTEFKTGDEVFGIVEIGNASKTKQGSLSQYLRITSEAVVHRPENITPIEAAGITLAAQTAYQTIIEHGKVQPGQKVFIYGGSSAVGSFAIQIAKSMGCEVVTSASGKNEEYVRSMGADEFIDYTTAPIHKQLLNNPPSPKFDAIIDTIGLANPSLYSHSSSYMKPRGIFVSVGPQPHSFSDVLGLIVLGYKVIMPSWLGGVSHPFKVMILHNRKADLLTVKNLLAEGKMRPLVDSTYNFENALDAYDRLMSSRSKGKVVVKVAES